MDTTYARFLGAGIAGGLELGIFHPVDTVAKRLMTSPVALSGNNYGEILFQEQCHGNVYQRFRSLFPGFGYGAIYKISQRVYKFGGQPFVKEAAGTQYRKVFGDKGGLFKTLVCDGGAGACMGAGEVVLLPFDVLKIKAQTNATYRGRNMLAVIKQEGFNLYAGWQWTMIRNVPGSFALFGVNGIVRDNIFKLKKSSDATFLQTCASSTAGSLASIIVACPFDVIKTRIQSGKFGEAGGCSIAAKLAKEEGFGAFFKGVVPKCGAVGPKLIFSFTIAQYLMGLFEKK